MKKLSLILLIVSCVIMACGKKDVEAQVETKPINEMTLKELKEEVNKPLVSANAFEQQEVIPDPLEIAEGERFEFDNTVVVGSGIDPGKYHVYVDGSANALLNIMDSTGIDKLNINAALTDDHLEDNTNYSPQGTIVELKDLDLITSINGKIILVKVDD